MGGVYNQGSGLPLRMLVQHARGLPRRCIACEAHPRTCYVALQMLCKTRVDDHLFHSVQEYRLWSSQQAMFLSVIGLLHT